MQESTVLPKNNSSSTRQQIDLKKFKVKETEVEKEIKNDESNYFIHLDLANTRPKPMMFIKTKAAQKSE